MIHYQLASMSEHIQATEFAYFENNNILKHSSYLSQTKASLNRDLQDSIMNSRLFLAMNESNVILGLLDTYLIPHLNRIDTSILVRSDVVFHEVAANLFSMCRTHYLPMKQYSFFFSTKNQLLINFLTMIQAKKEVTEYGLICKNIEPVEEMNFHQLDLSRYEDFKHLFHTIFPDIYKTPESILSDLGKKSEVLVYLVNQEIAGLCVLEIHPTSTTIEMICVKERFRHQGIGRSLLRQAKLFIQSRSFSLPLHLIVDTDNVNALQLYFDEGFTVEFENEHFIYEDQLAKGDFQPIEYDDVLEIASWRYDGYLREIEMTPYIDNYHQGKNLRGFKGCEAFCFIWNQTRFGLLELYPRVDGIEIGLAINPKFTSRGFFTPYMDEIIRFIHTKKKNTDRYIYIETEVLHLVASHVYKKYGFREISRDHDSILMKLEISA